MHSLSPRRFLSLRSATFRLGDRLIFQNTSWEFNTGEHWAVMGPNGSGKSLFADALRSRLPIVGGELHFGFRPPAGRSHEESIGHVAFEDRKVDLHDAVVQSRWNSIEEESSLRVRDYLSFNRVMEINPFEVRNGKRRERQSFERRLRQAISLLQISAFPNRTLISLSNGERQRVQLARALSLPLRLLILDDPFQGLDSGARHHFQRTLEHLMQTRLRVLLITNRAEDLPRQITHVLRIDHLKVTATGPRERMLRSIGARCSGEAKTKRETKVTPAPPKRVAGTSLADGSEKRRPSPAANIPPCPPEGGRSARPPGSIAPLIELTNVTLRYGRATILRDLNWTVARNESWALLGPNGAGKSALLSLIIGDNPQVYRNRVSVFGRERGSGESVWEIKQRIGHVSPELHLHFDDSSTCFDVVASGFDRTIGLARALSRKEKTAVAGLLGQFHLTRLAWMPLFALSLGQQRMALLARALVKKPELLILDEPCQGLDLEHRQRFVSKVDALIRSGTVTAIYVTHRKDEIPGSIKRVLHLSEGRGIARPTRERG